MVNFGITIAKAQYEPWRVGYIDYEKLKDKLDQKIQHYTCAATNMKKHMSFYDMTSVTPFGVVRKTLSFGNLSPARSVQNQIENKEFEIFLESELEESVLFFLKMQGELADRLVAAKELQGGMAVMDLDSLTEVYHSIGEQILLLVKFADINVTAVRKILKKHDKHFRHAPLSHKYCETSQSHLPERECTIEPLSNFSGIFALILALHRGMTSAAHLDVLRWEIEHPVRLHNQSREHLEDMPFLNSSLIEYDPVLAKLERVRTRRLHETSAYTKNLAAMSLLFIQEPDIDSGSESEDLRKPTVSEISRLLNHLSAFLYMANYYIVAPTSGIYATRLGGTEADSAIIIGMTPLAAQVGAVLFSWWANKSYKNPLIFASFCTTLGNFLYALALPCNSLYMVFLGRLLNGFGAARAINRRYLADAYSKDERTAASAMFVTYSSLGLAAGPLVSAVLSLFLGQDGRLVTVETAPGWLMTGFWGIYLVFIIVWFQEPTCKSVETSFQRKASLSMGERKQLLERSTEVDKDDCAPSAITLIPVMVTLLIYFVLKLALECLLSSVSMLATHYFQWHKSIIGFYLAFLGLLMFPTSLTVAKYINFYDDRELVVFFMSAAAFGIFGIVHYIGENYTEVQYVVAGIIIFCSTNSLEGVNMSLLSKTIPKSWAKHSILNSGLLATEAGTLGRTLGAFFLAWCAKKYGVDHLLNYAFIPVGTVLLLFLALTVFCYESLLPIDDCDEK